MSAYSTGMAARLQRYLPFLDWIREIRQPAVFRADLLAGVTVAMVVVPHAMANAQIAGLPVHYGLYAACIPAIVAGLFGSSRQLSTGPVALLCLMTATALAPVAAQGTEAYVQYAVLLALMVGVIQLILGMVRLGVLVDFLSHPVVTGFTSGAALIIATSQLGNLFGVHTPPADRYYQAVWNTVVEASGHLHPQTVVMGAIALAIMIVLKWKVKDAPHVLIAVVVTTVLSRVIGFQDMGGRVVGEIPQGLPSFSLPAVEWPKALGLLMPALTISLIAITSSMSLAKAMAAQTRQRIKPNRELAGQGLANIASGLFQGCAVCGSFARSSVNFSAGARTGFASVVTGVLVGATLFCMTPLLYHLPKATLAAVVIVAVSGLLRFRPMVAAWRIQRHDGLVAVATFVLTLVLAPRLDHGILIGVALSVGLSVYRRMRPRLVELALHVDGSLRDARLYKLPINDAICILRFDGSLYFASATYFEDRVLATVADRPRLRFLIVDLEGVNEVDATGAEVLVHLTERLRTSGTAILFGRPKQQVMDTFQSSGLVARIGEDHFFRRCVDALAHAHHELGEGQSPVI